MTIYHRGKVSWIKLAEMDPLERALFSVWLVGLPRPMEKEDSAYLFDYLRFIRQRRERLTKQSNN